ncbi:MAG: putative peptidoglycan glycosyltransferase FtsW [Bacteroidales bacterium]|nr:putative peptidoglycan glycosyltransferase FtsW [Bacteroidales bacterium]MDT8432508.1 putative peptidoglycan glycosyltransferase FtsW [Bacteroidales bacterium]
MNALKYIRGDRVIWTVIIILSVVSLLSVYSSTGSLAYTKVSGDTFYYLFRQFKYIILGLTVIILFQMIPYRIFSKLSIPFLLGAIVLLVITLIKGQDINEANRWLAIPGTSNTFQPSEFAKFALIMYLARVLGNNQNNLQDFKGVFLKLIGAISLVCILILPSNLSTAAIVFTVSFILLFIGRIPTRYLALFVGTGIAGLALFLLLSTAMSREGRITTWKNRIERYVTGKGDNFQADQAKVAIVRGGILPNGPGTSTQRMLLPHPYSDFIFAIIIEEYGSIIGGLLLIFMYLWLLFRTGLIVRRTKSTFGAFLAFGLSLGLVFQAFVNMGVAVGLLPVTGQTLPLVSMGGSSMLFTSMALGMILSISWGVEKEMAAQADDEAAEKENSEQVAAEQVAGQDLMEESVHEGDK